MLSYTSIRCEVGAKIKEIEIPSHVSVQEVQFIHPTNIKDVSSYNWIDASSPTIAVPGIIRHFKTV